MAFSLARPQEPANRNTQFPRLNGHAGGEKNGGRRKYLLYTARKVGGAITENLKRPASASAASRCRWRSLAPLVDRELQRLAVQIMARYRTSSLRASIEPAELVNEFYLRLLRDSDREWENRTHFFAYSAAAMRAILIDRYRAKHAAKRPPVALRQALPAASPAEEPAQPDPLRGVELRIAIQRLQELSPRQASIVDLKFFSGLDMSEIAVGLGLSEKTVRRDWIAARAFLLAELGGGGAA